MCTCLAGCIGTTRKAHPAPQISVLMRCRSCADCIPPGSSIALRWKLNVIPARKRATTACVMGLATGSTVITFSLPQLSVLRYLTYCTDGGRHAASCVLQRATEPPDSSARIRNAVCLNGSIRKLCSQSTQPINLCTLATCRPDEQKQSRLACSPLQQVGESLRISLLFSILQSCKPSRRRTSEEVARQGTAPSCRGLIAFLHWLIGSHARSYTGYCSETESPTRACVTCLRTVSRSYRRTKKESTTMTTFAFADGRRRDSST